MKRQFMPSNSSQGEEFPSEQPGSDHWLLAGTSNDVPSTRIREETLSPLTQRPASRGLLSGWKANQLQPNNGNGSPVPTPIIEQSTSKQPAVQRPITGATWSNPSPQNFLTGPVSPHQSGIGPSPAIFPGARSYPNFDPQAQQAPSMIPPVSQPLSPFVAQPFSSMPINNGGPSFSPFTTQQMQPPAGSPSQPLMPFAPVATPGQSQANWQTDGYGGQPPMLQPLPGEGGGLPPGKPGKQQPKRRFPIWARVVVVVLALLTIIIVPSTIYYQANFAAPLDHIVGQQAPLLKGQDNPNVNQNTVNPLSGGRINILLLGSDTDAKFQGGYLAQTDIVITIDPASKSVGMLSIPRDLYINVPGYGMMKLDEAYYTGDRYLHNAVGLSRLTITRDFGIPINYYAWVGLDGFIKVVDTAGGVDIDATHPITDDIYPDDTGKSQNANAYKRLYIAAGPQHFDGSHALEYVRSRHADLVGDFGRSARQQQVLSQLKTKLTNSPDIIGKLPQLAQDMNGYLKTDMNLVSIGQLMNFARTIDPNKIQRVVLSPPIFSYAGKSPGGEDIFIPNCAPIQQAIAKMFALGNKAVCNIQANSTSTSVATTAPQQPVGPVLQTPSDNSWPSATQMASLSPGGSTSNDFLGIHSLLDLLCLVVFESPLGVQV
ncbi:MAG: LCP family protein [Ktedonobacteraceae bacterium]